MERERLRALKAGGVGWAKTVAKVNIEIDKTWERVRLLLLALYMRKTPI